MSDSTISSTLGTADQEEQRQMILLLNRAWSAFYGITAQRKEAKKEIITYTAPDQSTIPHADYYRRLG
jgi:hypothetical protein